RHVTCRQRMRLMTRPLQPAVALAAAIILSAAASLATEGPIVAQAASLSVRIVGNHFVDGAGRTIRLLGVNRSGTEYECMANNGQGRQMADLDHAPDYWSSVASFFKNDHGVIFDLFNEPHDISWDCWLNGCTTSDGTGTWQAAGMQTLLNAVRATGATNVVTLSANGWGGDIPQWLNYRPQDPAGQIAAGWHVYFPETFYSDPARWASSVLPVAAQVPIATTELGEHDCADGWMNQFLPWADQHGLSYTAWTWDAWPDCGNPVLITKYDGSATGYGAGYRDHLRALSGFKPVATQAVSGPASGRSAVPA